ncbi:HDOD domain-containing protein [Sedimenticola selenatireducens]|jgi:putative nucleotidyltransferase with HDIG domain|uniref:HDOD domain-containing protein n=1 Tax=Sedimenticola selenatireducens TaxID=191960 RepID=A0A557RZG9_9GAMM|nr:HDOD domain-containing protein [Sedimenticola selenatireducens]TVO70519.1 HDOD domain-containing protein [Sedimenticola selenatireducens]TVT63096.1 MAG: HDOD domain-containing protein [Sedimenticola selenatireducens]
MGVDQDKLEKLVDQMPTFPQSAQRVMEICADINYSTPELVSVIERDPIITLKVLKLVNSAYFGLSKKITSIKHSVVYVGSNTIKNIAIAITTIGILPKVAQAGISRTDFLTHSLTTAVLAKLIGRSKGVAENELINFYIAGLLHDIGVILTAQLVKEEYKQAIDLARSENIPLHIAEQTKLDFNHADASALLVEKWQFPPALVDCIRNHHRMDQLENPTYMENSVFIANQLSKMMQDDAARISAVEIIPEITQDWLGMPVELVIDTLPDFEEEMQRIKAFMAL